MKKGLFIALLVGVASVSQAAMITVGGDQPAGTGTLTINQDITFNIIQDHSGPSHFGIFLFVFDEVVTYSGEFQDQFSADMSGLEYSVNGGDRFSLHSWIDNFGQIQVGDISENDGYIWGQSATLEVGDTVTLHAGTGTMSETWPSFNSWSSGDYNMFVADSGLNRISDAVPEPATAGLLAGAGLVITAYRRIRKTYGIE